MVHRKRHIQRLERVRISVVDQRKTYVAPLSARLFLMTDSCFRSGLWQNSSYVRCSITLGSTSCAYVMPLVLWSSRILNIYPTQDRHTWPISSSISRTLQNRMPAPSFPPSSSSSVANLIHSATSFWSFIQRTNVSRNNRVIALFYNVSRRCLEQERSQSTLS